MTEYNAKNDPALHRRGVFLMLGCVIVFAISDSLVKWNSQFVPINQIVFFRSLIGIILVATVTTLTVGPQALLPRSFKIHLIRTILSVTSMYGFYYGFSELPLAEAMTLGFASPLFITALSAPMLKEKVGMRRYSAVIVGFIGVIIILRPANMLESDMLFSLGALSLLGGALCLGLLLLISRMIAEKETVQSQIMTMTASSLVISACLLPSSWQTPPDNLTWFTLCIFGFLGASAQFMMLKAFSLAPPSMIAPLEYGSLIMGVIIGYLVWHEIPDLMVIPGAALIVGSGLYILHREAQIKLVKSRPRRHLK